MDRWLQKHLIPHRGNDHRPHLLRRSGTQRVIIAVLFIELIAFVVPNIANMNLSGGLAAVLPAVLGDLTNQERDERDLPVLAVNPLLTQAAEMKALDMATKGYFAHTSPEGKTPWYWIERTGYKYQYAGENLAVNFRDSEDVTAAWLRSPSHRANIVKGNYTEMGTGIARGVYKGRKTVFVAQVYANPLPGSVAVTGMISRETLGPAEAGILGAEAMVSGKPQEKPSFWQKLLVSPRNTTNMLLFLVSAIVATALVLYTAIKARGHERDLVWNGLTMLAVVGAVFVANYYYSHKSMVITEGYDYALEDTISYQYTP